MKIGHQITSDQPTEAACYYWFNWFRDRGVPAGIVRIRSGFFVFRRGNVLQILKNGAHKIVPVVETSLRDCPFELIMSCHGYEPGNGKERK